MIRKVTPIRQTTGRVHSALRAALYAAAMFVVAYTVCDEPAGAQQSPLATFTLTPTTPRGAVELWCTSPLDIGGLFASVVYPPGMTFSNATIVAGEGWGWRQVYDQPNVVRVALGGNGVSEWFTGNVLVAVLRFEGCGELELPPPPQANHASALMPPQGALPVYGDALALVPATIECTVGVERSTWSAVRRLWQ